MLLALDVEVAHHAVAVHREHLRLPVGPGMPEPRAIDAGRMPDRLAADVPALGDDRPPEPHEAPCVARRGRSDHDALRRGDHGDVEQFLDRAVEADPFDEVAAAQVDDADAAPGLAVALLQLVLQREPGKGAVARQRDGGDRIAVVEGEAAQEARAEGDVGPARRSSDRPGRACRARNRADRCRPAATRGLCGIDSWSVTMRSSRTSMRTPPSWRRSRQPLIMSERLTAVT